MGEVFPLNVILSIRCQYAITYKQYLLRKYNSFIYGILFHVPQSIEYLRAPYWWRSFIAEELLITRKTFRCYWIYITIMHSIQELDVLYTWSTQSCRARHALGKLEWLLGVCSWTYICYTKLTNSCTKYSFLFVPLADVSVLYL